MNPAPETCIAIGAQHGEDGGVLRRFYAVRYRTAVPSAFPWDDACFDCVVCVCDPALARKVAENIALDIVGWNVDWVDTTGEDAEHMHDLIDAASVRIGRQNLVGDGNPMTAWHEGAVTIPQIAKSVEFFGAGNEHLLLLVIGDDAHLHAIVEHVRRVLSEVADK